MSGRIVAATWWLFGFIIVASYTANLSAYLTVSQIKQPISSLDDLANQYKIKYAPLKGSGTEAYFKRMAEIEEKLYNIWSELAMNESISKPDRAQTSIWDYPVPDKYTKMWRFMQQSGSPNSMDEAMNFVLSPEEEFAYIGDDTETKYAVFTNCQVQEVGSGFYSKPYAIALRKGHSLKSRIDTAILMLTNERQIEVLEEKWWNNNPTRVTCADTNNGDIGMPLENIGGVFIVISAAIILSIITLTFEYRYYRKSKAHNGDHGTSMERSEQTKQT